MYVLVCGGLGLAYIVAGSYLRLRRIRRELEGRLVSGEIRWGSWIRFRGGDLVKGTAGTLVLTPGEELVWTPSPRTRRHQYRSQPETWGPDDAAVAFIGGPRRDILGIRYRLYRLTVAGVDHTISACAEVGGPSTAVPPPGGTHGHASSTLEGRTGGPV